MRRAQGKPGSDCMLLCRRRGYRCLFTREPGASTISGTRFVKYVERIPEESEHALFSSRKEPLAAYYRLLLPQVDCPCGGRVCVLGRQACGLKLLIAVFESSRQQRQMVVLGSSTSQMAPLEPTSQTPTRIPRPTFMATSPRSPSTPSIRAVPYSHMDRINTSCGTGGSYSPSSWPFPKSTKSSAL